MCRNLYYSFSVEFFDLSNSGLVQTSCKDLRKGGFKYVQEKHKSDRASGKYHYHLL
jgi:predicted transcriptional regulator